MVVPTVSVIMPVYNTEQYVEEAIESILNQTYRDFEFVIIDDGSTDATTPILEKYEQHDSRIRLISIEHAGLTTGRNVGMSHARGEYIAWMDSDDISVPERLEKQVRFMDANPDIGVCGSWLRSIGEKEGRLWRYETSDAQIRANLLFKNPIGIPSVMKRRSVFVDQDLEYRSPTAYPIVEDYDMWSRAARYTKFANLPEVLLLHRMHPNKLSRKSDHLDAAVRQIWRNLLSELGIEPTNHELDLHKAIGWRKYRRDSDFIDQANDWLHKILTANQVKRVYPDLEFSQNVAEKWYQVCLWDAQLGHGFRAWSEYRNSALAGLASDKVRKELALVANGGIYKYQLQRFVGWLRR